MPNRLHTQFHIPRLDTSLAAYRLRLIGQAECTAPSEIGTLAKISSLVTHEAHFFPNAETFTLHIHESSPFASSQGKGIAIDLWQDPECLGDMVVTPELSLQLDVARTLCILFQRFRVIFVAWTAAVAFAFRAWSISIGGEHFCFPCASFIVSDRLQSNLNPSLLSLGNG